MKTSCISHPENEPLLLIRTWQLQFCDGNACAAALLSFYEYWHNVKLSNAEKNRYVNDIAVKHGEKRTRDESLLQYHSREHLIKGIIGLYAKGAIIAANKLLEEKGVISIYRNSNPRYSINCYLFHPEVCKTWLEDYKKQQYEEEVNNYYNEQHNTIATHDDRKRTSLSEKGQQVSEKGRAITEITNRSFKKQIDKKDDDKFLVDPISAIQSFFHVNAGISLSQLSKPDSQKAITSLLSQGITQSHLEAALNKAVKCKPDEPFGLYYIKKIAESIFAKEQSLSAKRKSAIKQPEQRKVNSCPVLTDEQIEKKKEYFSEKNKIFTELSRELVSCKSQQEKSLIFEERNKLSMELGKLETELKQFKIQN